MPFKKGQSGNPSGKRKANPEDEAAAKLLPPGDEDELAAMRHVMNNQTDRTYQHWNLRRIWETNQDEFRKEYFGLVRAEKRASRSPSGGAGGSASPAIQPASSPAPSETQPTGASDQGTQNIAELLGERWVQYQEFKKYRVEFLEYLPLREAFRQWQEGLGPSRW